MLLLVNRQIFHNRFYLYFSTKREGLWFQWTIRNLDFFPFLLFCQTLTTGDWRLEVRPDETRVKYDDTDEGKDKVLHTQKFENTKRLIELHWLEDFSLWACLTGCSNHQPIDDDEHNSRTYPIVSYDPRNSLVSHDSSGPYGPYNLPTPRYPPTRKASTRRATPMAS
jgi:hypothetical protein